jgi:predicted DNA-binding WGR domain protein
MPSVEGGNHPISLDGSFRTRDSAGMITQPYHLYVERIAPEKNMARFYALAVQPTLFGEVSLVRAWGRIGTRGQQMVHLFDNESQAINLFLDVLREKRKRGYRPKRPVDIKRI